MRVRQDSVREREVDRCRKGCQEGKTAVGSIVGKTILILIGRATGGSKVDEKNEEKGVETHTSVACMNGSLQVWQAVDKRAQRRQAVLIHWRRASPSRSPWPERPAATLVSILQPPRPPPTVAHGAAAGAAAPQLPPALALLPQ